MARMAVMPEGHRDHKVDIPNNISQEAKQEASKSCPNCKIWLFRGGCGKLPSGKGNRKSYGRGYDLLAQGFKRSLKGFNSPFKIPRAKANIAT